MAETTHLMFRYRAATLPDRTLSFVAIVVLEALAEIANAWMLELIRRVMDDNVRSGIVSYQRLQN